MGKPVRTNFRKAVWKYSLSSAFRVLIKNNMKQETPQQILTRLVRYYADDKLKLILYLREEGYSNVKIGKVLDVDPSAISHFISRHTK